MDQAQTTSFSYQPMVYLNQTMGEMIQPVSVQVPSEALRRADALSGTSSGTVRAVNVLHRTSVLFPNSEETQWVSMF